MAIDKMLRKFGEDRTRSFGDMLADRHADRETERHAHHNTLPHTDRNVALTFQFLVLESCIGSYHMSRRSLRAMPADRQHS